jgi:hypothetical protein
MTTTINASTSSGLVVSPDNSGNVLLQYNGIAAPAFSYTNSTGTVIPSGAWTKITYDSKRFDTTSSMYSVANSRFTPTVAGYYQITGNFRLGTLTAAVISGGIYQNGVLVFNGVGSASSSMFGPVVTTLLYFNGSTDYVEIWGFQNSGSSQTTDAAIYYSFSGFLVRGA